ncbi:MAG: hypothetical protein QNK05_22445 [Myxococcota bacterium]|nr:hypothetical protein [Myxococcota bacterium]
MSIPTFLFVSVFMLVTTLGARRILGLWRRTRQLPELLIAIVMLGIGVFGVGVSYLVSALVPAGPVQSALGFLPIAGVHVGMAALWAFTWKVYRPDSPAARGTAFGAWAVLAGLLLYALSTGSARALHDSSIHWLSTGVYAGGMAWSAIEAFRYWGAMRKRMRLGLADAVTTNRFLLWGTATGCAALGTSIGGVAQRLLPASDGAPQAAIMLCYAGFGLFSAVTFWLAFLPPRAYQEWIRSRAGLEVSA